MKSQKFSLVFFSVLFLFSALSVFATVETTVYVQTQVTLSMKVEPETPGDQLNATLTFSPGNSGKETTIPLGENYHRLSNPQGKDRWHKVWVDGPAILFIRNEISGKVLKLLLKDGKVTLISYE